MDDQFWWLNSVGVDQVTSGELRLPDGDATADLYAEAVAQLSAAGLRRYEAASFARRGCESRHNGHYWHGVQYVGAGPGALGRFFPRRQHRRHRRVQVFWLSSLTKKHNVATFLSVGVSLTHEMNAISRSFSIASSWPEPYLSTRNLISS